MSPRIRPPSYRWVEVFGVLAALLCATLVWSFLRGMRTEGAPLSALLSDVKLTRYYLPGVEQEWIESGFDETYLVSPLGPLPCSEGLDLPSSMRSDVRAAFRSVRQERPDEAIAILAGISTRHWLPPLAAGTLKARDGDIAQAQLLLQSYLNFETVDSRLQRILASSRRDEAWSAPSSDEIRGLIYIQHALASIQIDYQRHDNNFWANVKNPIGCAKQLALRGELSDVKSMPTYSKLAILPPGCTNAAGALTTYDLYNNLLVAYLRSPDHHNTEGRQNYEFRRTYSDPPDSNPLLAVLGKARIELIPEREHWVWAISNAERILRWSPMAPQDARLSYNLAALLDSALAVGPPEAAPALVLRRDALLEAAIGQQQRLDDGQRRQLALGVTRLELFDASRRGRSPERTLEAPAGLTADQAAVADAVAFSIARRQEPSLLAGVAAAGAGEAREALGERAAAWLSASRSEVAATVARRALTEDPAAPADDPRAVATAARGLLDDDDLVPPELEQLEEQLGGLTRWLMRPAGRRTLFALQLVAAAVSGALVWLASRWLALQLRRRKSLLTSFYRQEAIAQRTRTRGAR